MSHLSDIGFGFSGPEEFLRFVEQIANLESNTSFASDDGFYNLWTPGAGVELWVCANEDLQLAGCSLHFAGDGRMQAYITQSYPVVDSNLRGTIYAWLTPEDETNPYTGRTPLAAAVPMFNCISEVALRFPLVTLQITGFVEGFLECFDPSSEFAPEATLEPPWFGNPEMQPEPNAVIAGTIVTANLLTNPETEKEFWHVLVDTMGGTVDLVADPAAVVDGPPKMGQRCRASCWISAQIVSELPRELAYPRKGSAFRHRRLSRRQHKSEAQ